MKRTIRIPLKEIPRSGIGVGDLVKRVAEVLGVEPCDGCEKRRQVLNRYVIKGKGRS